MSSERSIGTGTATTPLTRADVELLLNQVRPAATIDLSFHHLEQCNLSYLDLQGANMRGAHLQGANLRGTNLSQADLREANLSDADLDGADLSGARLGEHEANRAVLHRVKLSYATLRGLDLRGLDLQCADLNGTDLRHAVLYGTNLQGADLSTALLHGPELRGAMLYRDERVRVRRKQTDRSENAEKQLPQVPTRLIQAKTSSPPEVEQPMLADREALLIGERVWLADADLVKIRRLFPQGFTFAHARHLFDTWLAQTGASYTEREIQAIWIGFAHRLCLLYYEDAPDR